MGTVTISGTVHTIYGEHTGAGSADAYLTAALHATAWASASDDDQRKALVTATRTLDRQRWAGEKTDAEQALAWPRSGVTDRYGDEVDEDAIPDDVNHACYELAELLLNDALGPQTQTSAADLVKRVKAGSVEVEKWRPVAGGRFPTIVQELIGAYLAGSSSTAIPVLNGSASDASAFDSADFFDLNEPL